MTWATVMLGVAACAGWALAAALALSVRRRLWLVADAEHELRGAAAAIGLAAERVWRTGATAAFSSLVRLQLDRMTAGLEDLAAARAPWRAGSVASTRSAASPGDRQLDAGRLAQVLGNLVANATEHGVGTVDVRTSRPAGAVRIEIRNRNRPRELDDASAARAAGRGRGLAIAERAARELGGRLRVESVGGVTRAELELPAQVVDGSASTAGAGATTAAKGERPAAATDTRLAAARGERPAAAKGERPVAAKGERPAAAKGERPAAAKGERPVADRGERPGADGADFVVGEDGARTSRAA